MAYEDPKALRSAFSLFPDSEGHCGWIKTNQGEGMWDRFLGIVDHCKDFGSILNEIRSCWNI